MKSILCAVICVSLVLTSQGHAQRHRSEGHEDEAMMDVAAARAGRGGGRGGTSGGQTGGGSGGGVFGTGGGGSTGTGGNGAGGGNSNRDNRSKNRNPLDFFRNNNGNRGLQFVDSTCKAAEYECLLPAHRRRQWSKRPGGNGNNVVKAGHLVCRTRYDPFNADTTRSFPMCIDPSRAWHSDTCGCCADDCPQTSQFIMSKCNNGDLVGGDIRVNGGNGQTTMRDIVCRELYNPYTGDKASMTIPIPKNRGFADDVCGCCNGVCPDSLKNQRFERPPRVPFECQSDELVTCTIPGDRNKPDTNGTIACRERINPLTGSRTRRSVCINPEKGGTSLDTCGCCNDACPAQLGLDAPRCGTEASTSCRLGGGKRGVFKCRGMFHPQNGEAVKRTICIPDDKGFETDSCGCCDGSERCPSVPSSGNFETEEVQMLQFALESPLLENEGDSTGSSGDGTGNGDSDDNNDDESGVSDFESRSRIDLLGLVPTVLLLMSTL